MAVTAALNILYKALSIPRPKGLDLRNGRNGSEEYYNYVRKVRQDLMSEIAALRNQRDNAAVESDSKFLDLKEAMSCIERQHQKDRRDMLEKLDEVERTQAAIRRLLESGGPSRSSVPL
jgi:chromosome segregation ATPase